jgi:hypothetical protein
MYSNMHKRFDEVLSPLGISGGRGDHDDHDDLDDDIEDVKHKEALQDLLRDAIDEGGVGDDLSMVSEIEDLIADTESFSDLSIRPVQI